MDDIQYIQNAIAIDVSGEETALDNTASDNVSEYDLHGLHDIENIQHAVALGISVAWAQTDRPRNRKVDRDLDRLHETFTGGPLGHDQHRIVLTDSETHGVHVEPQG